MKEKQVTKILLNRRDGEITMEVIGTIHSMHTLF